MKIQILLIGMLLLTACCVMPAGAADFSDGYTKYSVTPWYKYMDTGKALPIYGTVSQGGTETYYFNVPANTKRLEIALVWGNSLNSMSLTIMKPGNTYFGPYYDAYENQLNGVIPLIITANPITSGLWRFDVKGENISGTQSFSLTINAFQ